MLRAAVAITTHRHYPSPTAGTSPADTTPEWPPSRSKITNLTYDIKLVADRFRQQAAEIAAILSDPDIRLADEAQHYRFGDLVRAAIGNLNQLHDLVNLSRHTGRNLTLARLAEMLDQFPPETPARYDNGAQAHAISIHTGATTTTPQCVGTALI